jgi:hypothetical protein
MFSHKKAQKSQKDESPFVLLVLFVAKVLSETVSILAENLDESAQGLIGGLLRRSKIGHFSFMSSAGPIYLFTSLHLSLDQHIDLLVLLARSHAPATSFPGEKP